MESLRDTWNIKVNKSKSGILTKNKEALEKKFIDEVPVRKCLKYLGMHVSADRVETVNKAWVSCKQSVLAFKRRFRGASDTLVEVVMNAYLRSVLRYFMVPLVCAGALSRKDLKKREMTLYRECTQ